MQRDSESQCRRQSHPSKLSENLKEGGRSLGRKTGERGRIKELADGQNQGSVAPPRSKIGQERREQRRCQGRSDGLKCVCQDH